MYKKAFESRWAEIKPLYEHPDRPTLTKIAKIVGMNQTTVGRIVNKAIDLKLTQKRASIAGQMPPKGVFTGSIHRALNVHDRRFVDWVHRETMRMEITLAELAVSALMDV